MRTFLISLVVVGAACAQTPAGLAKLSGRVLGPKSKPLSKTTLTLQLLGNPGQDGPQFKPYGVVTDAEGKYVFDGVDPGRYYLTATHNGYLRASYGVLRPGLPARILVLKAGQEVKDIDIELTPESSISGRVLDAEGEPMPRAALRVLHRAYLVGGVLQYVADSALNTDESGKYQVGGLAAGKYLIVAIPPPQPPGRAAIRSATPETGPQPTFYPSVAEVAEAEMIPLAAASQETGRDIRVRVGPVFHVRGTVPPEMRPKPGEFVRVSLSSRSEGWRSSAYGGMVTPDGSFDIPGVPSGPYTLTVIAPGGAGPMRMLASQNIAAGTPQSEDLKLQPVPHLTVTGVVKSSVPLPRLRIILRPFVGLIAVSPQPAEVKPDGSFAVTDVTPGEYRVGYSGMPEGGYVKSVKIGGHERIGIGIDLSDGVPGPLELTVAMDSTRISGIVRNKEGAPAASCTVTLTAEDTARTDLYLSLPCASDGRFLASLVRPGNYRIHAYEYLDPTRQYDPAFLKAREKDGLAVTVAPSTPQELNLVLQ